jgi:hypothetical protein
MVVTKGSSHANARRRDAPAERSAFPSGIGHLQPASCNLAAILPRGDFMRLRLPPSSQAQCSFWSFKLCFRVLGAKTAESARRISGLPTSLVGNVRIRVGDIRSLVGNVRNYPQGGGSAALLAAAIRTLHTQAQSVPHHQHRPPCPSSSAMAYSGRSSASTSLRSMRLNSLKELALPLCS